jgi:hypothetical protein
MVLAPREAAQTVRSTVTVVFCDLKGSTDLGERLDSEALSEVLDVYFTAMKAALERHGGTIEKYIGDAIMAVFGLPWVHEDDALRAVRAARDMQSALVEVNRRLEPRWGVTLQARIGVNTGDVVTGDPAAGQKLVTGDVRLKLYKGSVAVLGRRSDHGLYDSKLANLSNLEFFDNQWAKGFTSLWTIPSRLAARQEHPIV